MRCTNCKNKLLQKSGSRTAVRTQGPIVFEGGVCKAKCYWCKSLVTLPLQIVEGTTVPAERFVLRK